MAEDVDPTYQDSHVPDVETHVRDYSRFIQLFKWGAIISFLTGMLVLFIIA